jgi:hypothetical protein
MRKWFAALFCTLAVAATEPPRCSQGLRGTLWPPEANENREARRSAVQCGELRICTRGLWRLRWEPVGLPYWKMTGGKAPAACASGWAANGWAGQAGEAVQGEAPGSKETELNPR